MKKNLGYLLLGLSVPFLIAATGVGISTWTSQTGDIADGDLLGTTDVSDTTQSDSGTSKKITFTQLKDYLFAQADGDGGLSQYDVQIGDPTTTGYGVARLGNATLSRTSYSSGLLDIGGAMMFNNVGALDAGNNPGIEFLFVEGGDTIRLAVPESGAGNATAMIRSVTIAGPSSLNNNIVSCDTWTTNDTNIDCDTGTTGADLFVQDDLEVGGKIFTDEITEETAANGVDIDGVLAKDGNIDGGVKLISTTKSAAYTIGTDDADEAYGGVIYVTAAATITIPAIAEGMNFTVAVIGDVAVSVDPNANDRMYLDGTLLADGDKATNTSKSGDMIHCGYYSADAFFCASGSASGTKWTDGN